MKTNSRPHVVILGSGFGGLWAAKTLSNQPVNVTLIDRNNYHTFFPLLYQVASAELEPEDISYPIRTILRKMPNVNFIMTDITRLNFAEKQVFGSDVAVPFDYLIVAAGSITEFFSVSGAKQYAFQLKTLEQALGLRNHIVGCFERALIEKDEHVKQQLLTFVIVGGGPTGVELAGALSELINGPLKKDYPHLDFQAVRIVLVEAGNELLLTFPKRLREYAINRLRNMDVQVMVQTMVSKITPHAAILKDKGVLPSDTVIWTAGVSAAIGKKSGFKTGRNGRVTVQQTLNLSDYPYVYVIGDMADVETERPPLPMTAPVATQQGAHAANNVLRRIANTAELPFKFTDRGSMVTIGRNAAIAQIGKHNFTGFIAWIMWLLVHLLNLIGFRNRFNVFIRWAIDYIFYDRAARLIIPTRRTISQFIRRKNIDESI